MKRKIVTTGIVLVVVALLFAGCGQRRAPAGGGLGLAHDDPNINLSGTMPIVRDPSTFPRMTMAVVIPPERIIPTGELAMIQKLKEITGVEFDWMEIPDAGSSERINLMLASGTSLPDAFWNGIGPVTVAQYMDQDIFLPTEGLMERYMPRLRAIFEKYPEYRASWVAPNGHSYGFPYIEEMRGLVLTPGPFLINTVWLERVGMSMPTTVDEFVAVLRAFRDAGDLNGNGIADEIPYALDFTATDWFGSYNTFHQFTGAFGMADSYSQGNYTADHMRIIGGRVVFTAMDTAYRETARFFNMLRNENLLDVDSFTPGPGGTPLFRNKIAGSVATIGVLGLWAPANEIPDHTVRAQYQAIPRMRGSGGLTGFALNFSEMQDTSMVAITADARVPEVIAAYVDYCFEPEISITLNWGAEGWIYQRAPNGRLVFRLDENNQIMTFPPFLTFHDLRSNSTPARGAMAVLNEYYDTIVDYTWDAVDLLEGQIAGGKYDILAEYTTIPRMIMTSEEQNIISRIQPPIKDIVRRYTIQWVLDGNIDATWNNYLSELRAAGVDELVRTWQGAYDRFLRARS